MEQLYDGGGEEDGRAWPHPTELAVAIPGLKLVDWRQDLGSCACYAGSDPQGTRFRVLLARGDGLASMLTEADRTRRSRGAEMSSCIGVAWETRWREFAVLVTEWPPGQTLAEWNEKGGLNDDAKMAASIALCRAVEELDRAGCYELGLHPARVFVDELGRVRIDGLGFDKWLSERWNTTLGKMGRDSGDYADEPGTPPERRFLRPVATLIFEMFAGGLPRGSFFALPSQRSVFEPRLDELLMGAVGATNGGRVFDLGDLQAQLGRVVPGDGVVYVAPAAEELEEASGTPNREHYLDGMFSWMPGWFVLFSICVGLCSAAGIGFFKWKKEEEARVSLSGIDTNLALLNEVAELLRRGERDEALHKAGLVAESAPAAPIIMEKMGEVLVEAEEYGAFVDLGRDYLDREIMEVAMRRGTEGAIVGMWDSFGRYEVRIDNYEEANALVERARGAGSALEEYAALKRAASAMPRNEDAEGRLAAHPLSRHLQARQAVAGLGDGVRWKLITTVGGVELDLHGNSGLKELRPLRSCKFSALNISATQVKSLELVRSMGLRELAICGTPVRSLAAVGSGLERVWVAGAGVGDGELIDGGVAPVFDLARMKSAEWMQLGNPIVSGSWRNSVGMDLVSLPAGGWLAKYEVQARPFREFLRDTGRRLDHQGLPEPPGRWPQPPDAMTREMSPVAWVSRAEAEAFCSWLTKRERKFGWLTSKQRYRLPTDREWGAAAGYDELVHQGPRSRARVAIPQALPRVGAAQILMLEYSGMEEPIGGLGAEVDKDLLVAASKLAQSGRFQTARAADDLAVGVAEWLADSDGNSGFVRGGSWRTWAAWTGGDALLVRREVPLDARADDIGFRVFLEDASSRPVVDLNEMVAAGDWEGALTHVGRVRQEGRTPVERWAAGSVEDVLTPSPITESRGGDRYARVLWPMSAENARRFCQRIGGELAVPRNPDELKWLRRKFCRPNGFATIWIGPARLALPWPSEEVDAGEGERHAFVVRWREEASVAGAPLQEPQ